ncbi:hypothetical protein CR513_41520, partial [Mucuna pruriens]
MGRCLVKTKVDLEAKNLENKTSLNIAGTRRDITEDQHNIFLIVSTLVATATYQSAESPSGVYQANDEKNNVNNTSIKCMSNVLPRNIARSAMSRHVATKATTKSADISTVEFESLSGIGTQGLESSLLFSRLSELRFHTLFRSEFFNPFSFKLGIFYRLAHGLPDFPWRSSTINAWWLFLLFLTIAARVSSTPPAFQGGSDPAWSA